MKNIIILFTLFAFGLTVIAQTPRHINLELLGVYNLVGVSFDSRFSETSSFGYKVGIGYGYEKSNSGRSGWSIAFDSDEADFRTSPIGYLRGLCLNSAVSVPINAYYLSGKNNSHFEGGLGVCPYVADFLGDYYDGIGYYCFGRLGYRYESSSKPLSISACVDIPFKTPGSDFRQAIGLYPSISIGYRLR